MTRPVVPCPSCGREAAHGGYGWCIACYARWTRHGRPAGGPPKTGHRGGIGVARSDVDDVAVERAVAGHRTELPNPAELRSAVAVLRRRGLSARLIAERLGCAHRTVQRHLAAMAGAAR